ncbi:MAG TPA: protein DA1 [Candidatus Acidoferrales bacterium]|nr:protein DA1 [Candidatus Acidoferrales bacterium]
MKGFRGHLYLAVLAGCLMTLSAAAEDICAICGKQINDTIYLITDDVTGVEQTVCSDCRKLPKCFLCGLPVKDNGISLSDGRHICARDGKTAVLTAKDASQVANEVNDSLDKLFSRFTAFPKNVDVTVLDRIDVDKMYQPNGYDFESPNLLGCIEAVTNASQKRYAMRLMTGLPLMELKAVAAHELSHAWVGENVPSWRRETLSRNAEEGFCELVAYLLMDSQNEEAQKEAQKKFILQNRYTRGQIDLFIEAEGRFGFDEVLDWMQRGDSSELEEGHLEKIRDMATPAPAIRAANIAVRTNRLATAATNFGLNAKTNLSATIPAPATNNVAAPAPIKLQGIMWGNLPSAIINQHTVYPNDRFNVKIGGVETVFRCLEIQKSSVRIKNMNSGKEDILQL